MFRFYIMEEGKFSGGCAGLAANSEEFQTKTPEEEKAIAQRIPDQQNSITLVLEGEFMKLFTELKELKEIKEWDEFFEDFMRMYFYMRDTLKEGGFEAVMDNAKDAIKTMEAENIKASPTKH